MLLCIRHLASDHQAPAPDARLRRGARPVPGLARHPAASENFNFNSTSNFNKSVSSLVTLHGHDAAPGPAAAPVAMPGASESTAAGFTADMFGNADLYAAWCQAPAMVCTSALPLNGFERSASLLSNSQSVLRVFDAATPRAQQMFAARAFVHQYQQHGLETADFEAALMWAEQTRLNYRGLSHG
ncbi:hypothetical protein JKP88DRAFT_256262 [Tribonema minus]|uniref:Uncharacterized protein n=1 Tax=Tribonema minus TaxID=303371 RepID=A0A836CBY4_9STRA|nr:hypothetical protein JKP88DRAFT_256262 [Tribonema minus]